MSLNSVQVDPLGGIDPVHGNVRPDDARFLGLGCRDRRLRGLARLVRQLARTAVRGDVDLLMARMAANGVRPGDQDEMPAMRRSLKEDGPVSAKQ